MIARTHNIIAFASILTLAIYYPPTHLTTSTVVIALIANTIGSMLPDIDQASNKLWDMLPFGDNVGKILSNIFLSHRSLSHSLIGLFIADKIILWLLPKILNGSNISMHFVWISIMIGYISHLLADGLTEEGIPLLFPIKVKFGFPPIKSWRIKTGHWVEKYLITSGVVVYIFWMAVSNWGIISSM